MPSNLLDRPFPLSVVSFGAQHSELIRRYGSVSQSRATVISTLHRFRLIDPILVSASHLEGASASAENQWPGLNFLTTCIQTGTPHLCKNPHTFPRPQIQAILVEAMASQTTNEVGYFASEVSFASFAPKLTLSQTGLLKIRLSRNFPSPNCLSSPSTACASRTILPIDQSGRISICEKYEAKSATMENILGWTSRTK